VRPSPPRLAEALLRLALSPEDAEVITGDLEELLHTSVGPHLSPRAARRWYWRQTFSILGARLLDPISHPPDSPPQRTRTMAAIRQDLFYAWRSLRKQPAFTATALTMLAIGIGANVAIFSVANAVLLKPLPFADPDRLMLVHMLTPDRDSPVILQRMIWSYPKYRVLRDSQDVFESTAAFMGTSWNLTGSGTPDRVFGELIESTYFHVLGISAQLGRTFSAEETKTAGSPPLAVVGHGLWVRMLGSDPGVLGRTIGLNGVPHTIVGIAPPGFRGLSGEAEAWVPLMTLPAADLEEAWNHSYQVVARRKVDRPVAIADAEVKLLGARIDQQFPNLGGGRRRGPWGATAVALNDQRVDPLIRWSILLLLGAVSAVLLIVCLNLANLMLVRGLAREREVGIRLAVGASRLRIIRLLMAESSMLAFAGAVGGLAVAYAAINGAVALLPDLRTVVRGDTAGLTRVGLGLLGLDATTLLFTVGIAAGTALLFGLGPAWRTSRHDLTTSMKVGSAGSVSHAVRGFRRRDILIAGELALALVLLTAGGLMLKSLARLQSTELGFRPDGLLTFRVALPSPQYTPARASQFLIDLLARLTGREDIESVAYGSCAPVSGGCNRTTANFPDRPPAAPGTSPTVGVLWASPAYFETLGVRIVRGRSFTGRDRAGQPKVVVVSEIAARAFWGAEDPIGKRIGVGQGGFGGGAEVIGVAADVRYNSVETAMTPDVYLPVLQSPRSSGLIFTRSRMPGAALVPTLRREVQVLDADLPVTDVKMMDERFGEATWRTRISAWLLGIFATLALLLAALGVYGVMSQGVEQRRREIGVRIALGAARPDIMRLIIGRVVGISAAGVIAGILLAIPTMRLLTALLYQVSPGDPSVFAVLASTLVAVSVLAGYLPARRATRVDPVTTLRAD
jgi:putative ABC transport system permease protein